MRLKFSYSFPLLLSFSGHFGLLALALAFFTYPDTDLRSSTSYEVTLIPKTSGIPAPSLINNQTETQLEQIASTKAQESGETSKVNNAENATNLELKQKATSKPDLTLKSVPDPVRVISTASPQKEATHERAINKNADPQAIARRHSITVKDRQPPKYVLGSPNNPKPVFPYLARKKGWYGDVTLGVNVGPNGRAEKTNIVDSSGFSILDNAASKTIDEQWVFHAARQSGQSVAGHVDVLISFRFE